MRLSMAGVAVVATVAALLAVGVVAVVEAQWADRRVIATATFALAAGILTLLATMRRLRE